MCVIYIDLKSAYNTILRGELCGKGLKGSGNINNPHKDDDPHILFYGVDYWDTQSKLAKKGNIRYLYNLPYYYLLNSRNILYYVLLQQLDMSMFLPLLLV